MTTTVSGAAILAPDTIIILLLFLNLRIVLRSRSRSRSRSSRNLRRDGIFQLIPAPPAKVMLTLRRDSTICAKHFLCIVIQFHIRYRSILTYTPFIYRVFLSHKWDRFPSLSQRANASGFRMRSFVLIRTTQRNESGMATFSPGPEEGCT